MVSAFTNDANYVNTTQLATKQDTLVSGTSIKTINGQSVLGSGNITISGGGSALTVSEINAANSITNSVSNVTAIRFDKDTGFNVTDLGSGEIKVSLGSAFKTIKVAGQSDIIAVGEDTLNIDAGTGITLTTSPSAPKTLTINGFSGNYSDLVSAPTFKTINGNSIVGSGDITITGGTGASALVDLTDVSVPSPTDGYALVYNSSLSKWTAQDVTSGLYTNTATTTTLDPSQVVDSFAKTQYRTVKYMVQATSAAEVHSVEVTVMHTDINVFITEYNTMYSGAGKLFNIDATVNGLNIDLIVTPLTVGLTVDVTRIGLVSRSIGVPLPTDLQTETYTMIDLQTQTYPTKDLN